MGCSKCAIITTFICGGLFLISSIVLLVLWPSLYVAVLKNQLILTNTSKSFDLWRETPIPMYLEIFMYNITNHEKVLADPDGTKPHFEELGPYVFSEHHLKVNKTWHNHNDSISFWQRRTWEFLPEMSNGSLSDEVINLNVITITVTHKAQNMNHLIKRALNTFLLNEGEDLFIKKTVDELLFEGYHDPVVDFVQQYLNFTQLIPFDKFGWFYGRNESDTYDGIINMFTGAGDISDLGMVNSWNYQENGSFYSGECGVIKGGTGELFAPFFNSTNITIFATDICSSLTLNYAGEITVEGISGMLFSSDASMFDNGWHYPDEACYCDSRESCPPAGSRDVSRCKFDAPATVSLPHFYLADPIYLSKIDGLVPNRENDEFQIGLEVFTGIPLSVKAQLQINVHAKKISGFSVLDKLPNDTYFPMLWFRQEVKLTEEYASEARLALKIQDIGYIVFICILCIAVIILFINLICLFKRRSLSRPQSLTDLIQPDSDNNYRAL